MTILENSDTQNNKLISVLIASGAGGAFLSRCLASLISQTDENVEIIVVDRVGSQTSKLINENFPTVRLIQSTDGLRLSVPALRKIGVLESNGEIVAIIEEHCIASKGWINIIRNNFNNGDIAIGGPIHDANYKNLIDWVVYFSEYHNYLPPWAVGERYLLNGANIAYKRDEVLKFVDLLDTGYWEVVLHPLLAAEGRFQSIPEMSVQHTGPFGYKYYLQQRYLLSRVWGGSQRIKVTLFRRLLYLVTAPILPFFLLLRIASKVLKSRQYLDKFLVALPLLIPVTIAYVFGEWLGYLVGYGDALERVE